MDSKSPPKYLSYSFTQQELIADIGVSDMRSGHGNFAPSSGPKIYKRWVPIDDSPRSDMKIIEMVSKEDYDAVIKRLQETELHLLERIAHERRTNK